MRGIAILAALATGGGCVGGDCNGPNGTSDRCADPQPATLSTLELGQGQGELFVPLADGEAVPRVWGGQGLPMVVMHLRMTGQVPACLAQRTTLSDGDGNTLDTEPGGLTTYDAGGGARTSGQMFLILDYDMVDGDVVVVRSEAGGLAVERSLHLEMPGPDAMPDGGDRDAGDAAIDGGGAADATPTDAAGNDGAVDGG